jgi:hypothetical protein
MTGSRPQFYNGLVLIATFFSCRLLWGTYQSVMVGRDIWAGIQSGPSFTPTVMAATKSDALDFPAQYAQTMQFVSTTTDVPIWLAAIYMGSNTTLNSLNIYWFFKMIDAVRKRFDSRAEGEQQEEEDDKSTKDDAAHGTAVVATGTDGGITTRQRRRTLLDGEDPDAPPII